MDLTKRRDDKLYSDEGIYDIMTFIHNKRKQICYDNVCGESCPYFKEPLFDGSCSAGVYGVELKIIYGFDIYEGVSEGREAEKQRNRTCDVYNSGEYKCIDCPYRGYEFCSETLYATLLLVTKLRRLGLIKNYHGYY